MKKQPFCNFILGGTALTEFGLTIPSPFCSLYVKNSETDSYTSWELTVTVGGDSSRKMNSAAFEALIYSAAQSGGYTNASGIPVSFMFGWIDDKKGGIDAYLSFKGWTLKYSVKTTGMFLTYTLTGYASQVLKTNMPVLNIPALTGYVQPSAVLEGLAKGIKATDYYELDIDHCDAPTLVSHNAMTTSFTSYVRGEHTGQDDYDTFPGLLTLSKTYNATRDAAGLQGGSKKLSTYLNNASLQTLEGVLFPSLTDSTPQTSTYSFWIDEPTMTTPGIIHYKAIDTILSSNDTKVLKYGTSDSNILAINGSYDGVAYNMSNMSFATLGFNVDSTGTQVANDYTVVNSWSSSLEHVYQSASIINDINALATQFSGQFTVDIAGSVRGYTICEPVSLLVMSGNTVSPVSGVYNIKSVSHKISTTFVTTLELQRLSISSANQAALSMGIYVSGSSNGSQSAIQPTSNVKSTGLVDFGTLYPTWQDIAPEANSNNNASSNGSLKIDRGVRY